MTDELKLINKVRNPIVFNLLMLKMLPIVWISGIKINTLTPFECSVRLRYQYITKNPFKSIYFACLAMAAELSSGVLALIKIKKLGLNISMLVTEVNAAFYKKATGKITFSCNDGTKIEECIQKCISSNKGEIIEIESVGKDESGQIIARFQFQWSFKVK
jgi:hypothetical protein